jgi:hypothetical protein
MEDKTRSEQTDDESQDKQDLINTRIWNSPIRASPTQVFRKQRMMQTAMMTTT